MVSTCDYFYRNIIVKNRKLVQCCKKIKNSFTNNGQSSVITLGTLNCLKTYSMAIGQIWIQKITQKKSFYWEGGGLCSENETSSTNLFFA